MIMRMSDTTFLIVRPSLFPFLVVLNRFDIQLTVQKTGGVGVPCSTTYTRLTSGLKLAEETKKS